MSKYWRPTRASAVSRRSWATWLLGFVGSSLPLEKIERTGPRLLPFPSQSSLRPALPAAFLRADARALGSRALLLSSPPPSGHDSDRPQRRWRHGGTSGAVRQSGDRLLVPSARFFLSSLSFPNQSRLNPKLIGVRPITLYHLR
uniref:Uncharacterized protein n=1 Tax=Setaria viridis TaxID=4556 RepID=A0A4U6TD64_SETVI|nr:hypothetical protein SEVIR_8G083500v2 [Setaria viridis]